MACVRELQAAGEPVTDAAVAAMMRGKAYGEEMGANQTQNREIEDKRPKW
jgi:hypothetical protein